MRKTLAAFRGRVVLHFLPPYCPDANRIECVWQHLHANVIRLPGPVFPVLSSLSTIGRSGSRRLPMAAITPTPSPLSFLFFFRRLFPQRALSLSAHPRGRPIRRASDLAGPIGVRAPLLSRFPLEGVPLRECGLRIRGAPGRPLIANEPTEKAAPTKETIP